MIQMICYALMAVGCGLLLTAGALLWWCVQILQQILNAPEELGIIRLLMSRIEMGEPIVSGVAAGADFQVNLSDVGESLGFLLLALFALAILASIIRALITGGVNILRRAMAMQLRIGVGVVDHPSGAYPHKIVR